MAFIRLLHRQADGDIVSRKFVDDLPVYAILSHTWGEEEIEFEEMKAKADMSRTVKKAGWKKIQFCAEKAAADGLQYFWVDTCCIDKTSSAELSSAIISMFRWYKGAARCYVYLSDVSKPDPRDENESDWKEQFRTSRWFTRGWTLQELVAPPVVQFFSLEGSQLGNKSSLEQDIQEITKIPIQELGRSRISEFSVNKRMSRAKARRTKIEEDQVYCLLGLLDVNMAPRYGEGRQKALWRLYAAIRQTDQQQRGKGWDSQGTSSWNLIHSQQRHPLDNEAEANGDRHDSSPYEKFRSLSSTAPVLDIPTRKMGLILAKLPTEQHVDITTIIIDNCRKAAYDFYTENALWRTKFSNEDPVNSPKLFQLQSGRFPQTRNDLDLRAWIRKIQHASSRRLNEHDAVSSAAIRDYFAETRYPLNNALNIMNMTDPWTRLRPLEFQSSLCYAISWCRHLYSPDCEARLEWLWVEMHSLEVDADWTLELHSARVPA